MRKFKVLTIALAAICAFGALSVSQASAVSKVLVNAAEPANETLLIVGDELLLEDMNAVGKPDILCSGEFDFLTFEKGTLLFIDEVLMLGGELLADESGNDMVDCTSMNGTCEGEVLVSAVNLPWHVVIELSGTTYIGHIANEAGKTPGYTTDCNTFLGLVADTCTGETGAILTNETGGVLGVFSETNETITLPGNCTVGGEKQALLAGEGLITSPSGAVTMSE